MRIRLGYVAISKTLEEISYNHTITYTNYQKLKKEEQFFKLDSIMNQNLDNLLLILKYNVQNQISFFRFSHNLVPLATHNKVPFDYITPYKEKWKKIGDFILKHKLRVDTHPDQFCVLNSIHESVVIKSIEMLKFQEKIYQAMGIDGHFILHIGSGIPDKESAKERFRHVFHTLPKKIQKMILLENDDKTFTVQDTLELCEQLKIPMVLDYHHYLCNKGNLRLEKVLKRILNTWNDLPVKMHFSSPKSQKEKRAHSAVIDVHKFISFLNLLAPYQTDIDIMLECKGKDESLFRLSRQLQFYTNYQFLNNSTFLM